MWVGENFHLGSKVSSFPSTSSQNHLLSLNRQCKSFPFSMLRLLGIGYNVAGKCMSFKNESLSMWDFEFWILKSRFWLFYEYWWKIPICKEFWCCLCIGIDRKEFGFVLGQFESHERQFYKILKFCIIQIHWSISHSLTNFASTDHFHVQWPILSPVTSFKSSD